MKNFLSLLILINSFFGIGQTMPSPTASNTVANANVPVNLYKGVASVSVPLYTASTKGGAKLPISLQYNTTGIKVHQRPGVVGLGWQLIAGGEIVRVLRNDPDENSDFVIAPNYQSLRDEYYRNGDYDTEKDLFFFSYPGGGGKFVFNGDPGVSLTGGGTWSDFSFLPGNDLKLKFIKSTDNDSQFELVDLAGNKYIFGGLNYVEKTELTVTQGSSPQSPIEFISSWKLQRIELASELLDITFTYQSRNETYSDFSTQAMLDYSDYSVDDPTVTEVRRNIAQLDLSRITIPNRSTIDFLYKSHLDHITVTNVNGDIVHDFDFEQDYFDAHDSYRFGAITGEKGLIQRLKLNGISYNGETFREFDYYDFEDNARYQLPPTGSFSFDHFGYYNGIGASEPYVRYAAPDDPNFTTGLSREPNDYCKANILKSMTYPTGGFTTFSYGFNPKNGGARIQDIISYAESSTKVSHLTYEYDPADENDHLPIYYVANLSISNTFYDGFLGGNTIIKNVGSQFVFSHALSLVYDLNGPMGGYKKVKVVDQMKGTYSKHFFKSLSDYTIQPARKKLYMVDLNDTERFCDGGAVFCQRTWYTEHDDFIYPFASHDTYEYRIGLEYKTEAGIIDVATNTEKKLSVTDYEYKVINDGGSISNFTLSKFAQNKKENWPAKDNNAHWYIASSHTIFPKRVSLDYKTDYTYEDNSLITRTRTDYEYHSIYPSLVSLVTAERTDNTGEAFNTKVETFYTLDYDMARSFYTGSFTTLTNMVNDDIINVPIATVQKIDLPYDGTGYWTNSSSHTTFQKVNGMYFPYRKLVYEIDRAEDEWYDEFEPELVSTTTYGLTGLMASHLGRDGIATNYSYDFNGYLTTETVNPGLGSLQRITRYTHEPLVGIKTVIDPTGEKLTYEYDYQNRLHLIRDSDNNIIKRYRYNTRNQSDASCEVMIEDKDYFPGDNVEVKAECNFYGNDLTTYKWKINGVDHPSTSQSFSYQIPQDASFNIYFDLTAFNSESAEVVDARGAVFVKDDEFFVTPSYFDFPYAGGTGVVDISPAQTYTLSYDNSMIEILSQNNGKISFRCLENESEARQSWFIITPSNGGMFAQVVIDQDGAPGTTSCGAGCVWNPATNRCEDAFFGGPCIGN